jgi:hypothetical protein
MENSVHIEIGPNLKEAILAIIRAVDKENRRDNYYTHDPGATIQRAFKLDLTRVAIEEISKNP